MSSRLTFAVIRAYFTIVDTPEKQLHWHQKNDTRLSGRWEPNGPNKLDKPTCKHSPAPLYPN